MKQPSLELLATQMVTHLDCTQDVACQQILRVLAETGQPLAPTHLAHRLQMSQEQVVAYLTHLPDTEFDPQGNIVGWGMTLVPTQHQFWVKERALFTWCAFDTVLFPPLLALEAEVHSECAVSGQPIRFRAGPEGIEELIPMTSVLSLILPATRCDCVRRTFCQQSLFFQSKEAASLWMALHPETVLLSVEEAAALGHLTASLWPPEGAQNHV
ncbi:MAG: alkylmercury lyase [Ktedonobacteraceae bacterium]|nr:alkylmercury lyase [Ktedonobacteraceae bacterium]